MSCSRPPSRDSQRGRLTCELDASSSPSSFFPRRSSSLLSSVFSSRDRADHSLVPDALASPTSSLRREVIRLAFSQLPSSELRLVRLIVHLLVALQLLKALYVTLHRIHLAFGRRILRQRGHRHFPPHVHLLPLDPGPQTGISLLGNYCRPLLRIHGRRLGWLRIYHQ